MAWLLILYYHQGFTIVEVLVVAVDDIRGEN